jgi:8-oxo-dGTP pyrophosphatase MutT (NUDIX family)
MLLFKDSKILLGLKKRGFGMNKIDGFGGKVEKNETIYQAAIRETKEECGIDVKDAKFIGLIRFQFEIEKVTLLVYIFISRNFEGKAVESEEMLPEYFDISDIPYDRMWKDYIYWYPHILEDKCFYAEFYYSDYENILSHSLVDMAYEDLVEKHNEITEHKLFDQ